MKLETLLEHTSNIRSIKEKQLLYLERFVNDAKGEFGEYSDVDPKYSPRGGMRTFLAPYADVKKTRLKTYQDMPDRRLMEAIFQDEEARFVLHPETKSPFDSLDGSYVVSPSSSTRTLMTRELPYNFQAKTQLE